PAASTKMPRWWGRGVFPPAPRPTPGPEGGPKKKKKPPPADRIEVERVQGHRSRLVHDDSVGIGEFRYLPGEAVGDDRALLPVGIVHHLGARGLCPLAEFAHVDFAVGSLLPQPRGEQLLDRRDEIVKPVADVADERHLGDHDVTHAAVIDAHVDEFRAARYDRRRTIVLELIADIDDHVGALWIVERIEAVAGEISDP